LVRKQWVGRRWVVAATATAIAALAGCGPSGHRYVANKAEKVYLRVPTSWHDIALADGAKDPLLDVTSDAKIISKSVMSPQKGATGQADLDYSQPVATMTVYEVGRELSQKLSPSSVRLLMGKVGFDPVLPPADKQGFSEVIDLDLNPTNAAASGSRVVYRARSAAKGDWIAKLNLTTFFDPSDQRLYVLEVDCTLDCYDASVDQIDSLVNSWRIG
jgi:hypothetical protein